MGEYTFKGLLILVLAVVAFFAFRAGIFWASSNRSSSGKDTTTEQISSDASLEIINVEHEVSDGVPGMRIYIHGAFNKYKGKTCTLEILFFDNDGNPLPDRNNIASINGQVGASSDFVVDNVPGEMNVDLFFPYEELDFTSRTVYLTIAARFIIKGKTIAETSLPGLQLVY